MINKFCLAVFFALMSGGAAYCLLGLLFKSPAAAPLATWCPESYYPIYETKRGSEAHRVYSGIGAIDQFLCTVVVFFTTGMEPNVFPTTLAILTAFPSVIAFITVESARRKAPGSIIPSIGPVVIGVLYQRLGAGIVLPLYWIFILFSGRLENKTLKQVAPRQALAVFAAMLVGYYPLTYLMLSTKQVFWTGVWQPFPLLIALVQTIALLVVPNIKSLSGARIVQTMYAVVFVISAASHLSVISQTLNDPSLSLKDIFVPSITPITGNSMALVSQNFLRWDYFYLFAPAAILSLAFASSFAELLGLVVSHLALTAGFGAGSAFAAVMIYREGKMLHKSKQLTKIE